MLAVGFCLLMSAVGANAVGTNMSEHPFLFMTPEDISRIRDGIARSPELARQAEELREAAAAVRQEELPVLETAWWEADKDKPWGETYPQINEHTGQAPRAWASAALNCARAGVIFEDEPLCTRARGFLLGLSDYTFEFDHYDVGMNYTTWGVSCLEVYDLLYDSFTAEERARLDAFFERMVKAIVRSDDYWIEHMPGGPMNNHYAWHKLGRIMYGLFYGKPEMVDEGLFGPKGVVDSMRYGFTGEGLWLEASLNYQFAQTAAMVRIAELLENAGHGFSLWSFETDDVHTLKQAYDALIPTLFPDGTLPNIGDCYAHRAHLGEHLDYEALLTRFGDPVYAWLLRSHGKRPAGAFLVGLPALPEGEAPSPVSRIWPEHGYAMLRTNEGPAYWDGNGWSLFASYSNAPVHQNQDKLSIMLFGDGHHWLVDAEGRAGVYHAFSSAMQRELNRSVVAHNTVMVDRREPRHPDRQLNLLECQFLPHAKRVTMGDLDSRLYAGVRQLRTIIVRDDYVLDFFQVESEAEHNYAWLTHVDGEPESCSLEEWAPATLPDEAPWRWLRDAREAGPAAAWSEAFSFESKPFRMDVSTDAPADIVRCSFPRNDSPDPPTYAMRMARRHGQNAWFAAVYQRGGAAATVRVEEADMGRWDLVVTIDGHETRHLAPMLSKQR